MFKKSAALAAVSMLGCMIATPALAQDLDVSGALFGFGGGVRTGHADYRIEYSFISGDATSGVLGMFAMYRF